MIEATQVMDDEQKARSPDDCLPEFGKMSLTEVGIALESHLLAPEASQQCLWVNFVLRHSRLEREGDDERHSLLSALDLPHSG